VNEADDLPGPCGKFGVVEPQQLFAFRPNEKPRLHDFLIEAPIDFREGAEVALALVALPKQPAEDHSKRDKEDAIEQNSGVKMNEFTPKTPVFVACVHGGVNGPHAQSEK